MSHQILDPLIEKPELKLVWFSDTNLMTPDDAMHDYKNGACVHTNFHLCPEEDQSILVETLAKFSSCFQLVSENHPNFMQEPTENPPLSC